MSTHWLAGKLEGLEGGSPHTCTRRFVLHVMLAIERPPVVEDDREAPAHHCSRNIDAVQNPGGDGAYIGVSVAREAPLLAAIDYAAQGRGSAGAGAAAPGGDPTR